MSTRVVMALLALALLPALPVSAQALPDRGPEARPETETPAELIARMAADDFQGMAASRGLAAMGPRVLPELIRAAEHDVPRVRYWSVAAMSSIGDERAVPAVLALFDDPDDLVRAVAIWHSGRWFHRDDVRTAVLKKLDDPSPFVRGWTMKLIQARDYREAADEVRRLLEAAEPEVRYDALHTLAVLEGPDVLPTLKTALEKDESPLVREGAVRCCSVLDPPTPGSAEVLIAALADSNEEVRRAAVTLLRKGFGQHFGFEPDAEPLEREKAVRQWHNWYEANAQGLRWNPENRRFEAEPPEPAPDR